MPGRDLEIPEAPVDSLVRIAQARFETQDFLADDREAEMPGLDDPGVDRSHGDLVDAVALDPHEGVVVGRVLAARVRVEIAAQRELVRTPRAVAQPLPPVTGALGGDAEQVVQRALHAQRTREYLGDGRIRRRGGRYRKLEDDEAAADRVRRVYREGRVAIAVVRAPKRHDPSRAFTHHARRARPLRSIDPRKGYRRRAG